MSSELSATSIQTSQDAVVDALDRGKYGRLRKILQAMHPGKLASLLEALNHEQCLAVWQQMPDPQQATVLRHLDPTLAEILSHGLDEPELESLLASGGQDSLFCRTSSIRDALESGRTKHLKKVFQKMHPARAAGLLEALLPHERTEIWKTLDTHRAGKILVHLHGEVQAHLALEMTTAQRGEVARQLALDDLVDLIQTLPDESGRQLLAAIDESKQQQLTAMLSYPEDSAGGLMNVDHIAVRADVGVRSVLRYLRLLENLPDHTDKLIVVDRKNRYQGVLRLSRLVTSSPDTEVGDVMDVDFKPINVNASRQEVAKIFEELDILSAAVTDDKGMLLGRITVDDVVDIIREEADRALMNMAGLDDEADMFAPVLTSSKRRAVWLGINLVTAFLAAWVIGLFQGTLEQIVALAVLMPIVASMGGIAGSQTLTLVIRGLALGQVDAGNTRILLMKEIGIGLINGVVWSLVVAALAIVWFGNWAIGGIIAAAILINLICAALAGLAIPLVLRRFGIDPALAGGVILTTVTDVVGFFAFLGLATLLLIAI